VKKKIEDMTPEEARRFTRVIKLAAELDVPVMVFTTPERCLSAYRHMELGAKVASGELVYYEPRQEYRQ